MAFYEFKCVACLTVIETMTRNHPLCTRCDMPMRRVFSFEIGPREAPGHWNPSTGNYVRSNLDFKDQLKRLSDKQSEELGMTHQYEPVDLDPKALGVTDEGMESTRKVARDKGNVGPEKGRKVIV